MLASAGQALGYVVSTVKVIFMATAILLLALHWTLDGPRTIRSLLLLFPQGKVNVLMGRGVIPMPALVVIGLWIVLQFFSGFGSIANSRYGRRGLYGAHWWIYCRVCVDFFISWGTKGAGINWVSINKAGCVTGFGFLPQLA